MRQEFSSAIRLAAWDRCKIDGRPHCEKCHGLLVGRGQYDHIKPDGLGGLPTLDNCMVMCSKCHSRKTHMEDRPVMAKADRQKKSHAGVRLKRPFGNTRYRKKVSGEVVERD